MLFRPPPLIAVESHCRQFPRLTYTTACGTFSDLKSVRPLAMCSCQNIEHAFQQCRGVLPLVTRMKALLCFARVFPYRSRAVSSEIFWGALAKNIGEMALGPILCVFLERIVPDAPPTFTKDRKRGDVEQWFYLSARKAVKRNKRTL